MLMQDQDDPTVALFRKILQSHQRISLIITIADQVLSSFA